MVLSTSRAQVSQTGSPDGNHAVQELCHFDRTRTVRVEEVKAITLFRDRQTIPI